MKVFTGLLMLAAVLVSVSAKTKPLPSYIKPCSRTDPKLEECAKRNGQAALKTLIKGDRMYSVPVLDPLAIKELSVLRGNGSISLEMKGKNMQLIGFKAITIKSTKIDLVNKVVTIDMFTPKLSLIGDYLINGKILILPITGNGFCNLTLDNVDFKYIVKYNLMKKSDGLEYVVPYANHMSFKTTRAYIRLDNLFNGDKTLSDNMNLFMNQNWELINSELGPPLAEGVGDVLQNVLTVAVKDTPYDDVFLE